MDNNLSNNQAIIIGTIEDEFVFNHEIYAEKFYTFTVKVPRLSGASDNVRVLSILFFHIGNKKITVNRVSSSNTKKSSHRK